MVHSATLVGVQGQPISVEVHVSTGLPSFTIVGLPDASCRESRDRVRAAILSSGLKWPQKRVTVNLAPTSVRKGGSGLDLPIAIALLAADGQLPAPACSGRAFIGELGLDGSLRRVPGVLPLVDSLRRPEVVLPPPCAAEVGLLGGTRARCAATLGTVVQALIGARPWDDPPRLAPPPADPARPDLADVRGQPLGRLAVEVAAAGGHHLLMVGPPGAGKTMLAERLVGLLPDLTAAEAVEVARIHSAAGLPVPAGVLSRRPPFRAPHHSASPVSLVGGGGVQMRPGELSCAHRGVLFLDELGEFPADVLDVLRQPLEEGQVLVCRARASVTFPARVLLVAAMNPCPCGSEGGPGSCRCREAARSRYGARVSGPLLDRFDIRIHVDRPDVSELVGGDPAGAGGGSTGESTAVVAGRVEAARRCARRRGVAANSDIPARRLDELAPLERAATRLLETRMRQGWLSARGLHRIRRVARTIADLAGWPGPVREQDVYSALALRAPVVLGGVGAGRSGAGEWEP
ncbi:MAG TPA: YifB family Mg chelatase-like AAA ATPase [Acidimicrobiales bacterium]|nr:YifB family Mg chelatase-like AAA ATPase [Acidimicrobiales bacterium]